MLVEYCGIGGPACVCRWSMGGLCWCVFVEPVGMGADMCVWVEHVCIGDALCVYGGPVLCVVITCGDGG